MVPVPYFEMETCDCCRGVGKIKNGEDVPTACPYCRDTPGQRKIRKPHPSHKMSEWRSEIRCPGATERFYSVRDCSECGMEEMRHAAGHFMEKLQMQCQGGA